ASVVHQEHERQAGDDGAHEHDPDRGMASEIEARGARHPVRGVEAYERGERRDGDRRVDAAEARLPEPRDEPCPDAADGEPDVRAAEQEPEEDHAGDRVHRSSARALRVRSCFRIMTRSAHGAIRRSAQPSGPAGYCTASLTTSRVAAGPLGKTAYVT